MAVLRSVNQMAEISRERQLFREAADLAIRLQNDPANPVAVEMVRSWIARGPDHLAAWARVAAIHGMTGDVLTEQCKPAFLSRRGLVIAGLLGLGGTAMGAWHIPYILLQAQADHLTSTAEQQRIDLADGSIVTLGPDSASAVRITEAVRQIDLLQGMAFFEVAPDLRRRFTVKADRVEVGALGTACLVKCLRPESGSRSRQIFPWVIGDFAIRVRLHLGAEAC
jgi:transmembrane sensor